MIQLVRLRKEFDDLVAVNGLNVEIAAGEIYGLIGPNGAGKTTTIRMACGLLAPTEGHVVINGIDVQKEPEQAQRHVGYLSDFFSVYEDLKVWEYLDYFANAYKLDPALIPARIEQVIAEVGLEVKRDSLIHGLSRGMKQRLGIARAIVHRPEVLLLDEPASGLDPKARLDLRNLLLKLRDQGCTILISSHILSDLEGFCTSIGIMEKGRMIRSGRIAQIREAEGAMRVLRIAWLGTAEPRLLETLRADSRISEPVIRESECMFKFQGAESDVAALLPALLATGQRIVYFGEVQQTVEDLYVKISHNEVL
jgi:ABC-2 type transport system ATP-binding protein